ncbi:hypothetical protein [Jiella mangrovi]|uniref:DUF4148 domain-containing protein n=1 Tax=Jiella mangrovi TaxID=2821407 RepID=A0ABS4BEQ6_9HYPH|nr:hypothetical protein [Jiella mangrovi]MBP0615234.1 hypothetical protein [Jiella mangrovi]
MIGLIAPRVMAAVAMAGLVSGCQSAYDEAVSPQAVAYQRVAPDGRSGQRLGPDGYPLLGAYPNSAARQVDDATVTAQERRAAAIASRRKGTLSTRSYDAEIARMQRVKRRQAEEVDTALAQKPSGNAVRVGTQAKPSRSPDDVLREIQSSQ